MAATLPLLGGHRIGLSEALRSEVDIIRRIAWYTAAQSARADLEQQNKQGRISSLVAHHLGVDDTQCGVEPTNSWPLGSFNQCVLVDTHKVSVDTVSSHVLVRVPMAHRLTGMVDEKMRCEIATYIWIHENCPDIPIPRLYAFGFPDGRHFTHTSLLPWYRRWTRYLQRRISTWLGRPVPSYYVENPWVHDFSAGYILLEFIDKGKPLFKSWSPHGLPDPAKRDSIRRENLFRGISRLILSLARVPLDRIGSFTFDPNTATISLANRPLTCDHVIIENDGAAQTMDAAQTYETVDPYIADVLALHDNRLRAQPNAVLNLQDCYSQMAIHLIMKALSHEYPDCRLRRGPFRMQFTDLHQGNLIVDDDWNIIAVIDLEWICSRSPQMIDIPHWITSRSLDEIASPEHSRQYAEAREYFLSLFKEEEESGILGDVCLSEIMERSFSSGATWFFNALDSINVMYHLFEYQLRPQYMGSSIPPQVDDYFARFWSRGAKDIAIRKVQDKEAYDAQLKDLYQIETDQADTRDRE